MKKGFFVVIEGSDGAGKTTQVKLLAKYFKDKKIPFEVISFPRYGQNLYANLVKDYLEGNFGKIGDVDPYLISLAFAGDRVLAKPLIEKWLNSGKVVIANRYVSSNKAHMGANLLAEKREEFFKWLDNLEYQQNRIPKEDLTILLVVDPAVGQKNSQVKNHPDIHEDNLKHLEKAAKIYLELSRKEKNWAVTYCMEDGQMRTPEDIHKDLVGLLKSKIF